MYMKLDEYFYFSAFDLEVKVTEILTYIFLFSAEKHGQTLSDLKIDSFSSLILMLLQGYRNGRGQIAMFYQNISSESWSAMYQKSNFQVWDSCST